MVNETEREDFPVVCANGCPEGYLGRHKMSCEWAGQLFYNHREVRVLGVSPSDRRVCIEFVNEDDGDGKHQHVPAANVGHVRYPDVRVQLSGEDGNTMMIIGRVCRALRHHGYGPGACYEFSADVMNAESYDDALRRVMRWVAVS